MRPERRNAVKVLVFFDIGGSMDSHIEQVEELFSAAKTEFKHMEYFYFHNCLYEGVWKQNKRRFTDRTPTWDVLHKYPHDYKVVFVGDASMSPYEIMVPGGSVEHVNEEAGLGLARPHHPHLSACGVAQSGGAEALGLFGIDHHHPPHLFRPHVSDHDRGSGRGKFDIAVMDAVDAACATQARALREPLVQELAEQLLDLLFDIVGQFEALRARRLDAVVLEQIVRS